MFGRSRSGKSTRQLMGIDRITRHGVKTPFGEWAYFLLKPDNLSILSPEGVRNRVNALSDLLKSSEEIRLIALDARESYRQNQEWYRNRMEQEAVPAIRDLLRADTAHLTRIIKSREPLLHCAVFIELIAPGMEELKKLKNEVLAELSRGKIGVDQLILRQREGFLSVQPAGRNLFASQYERVLPAPSGANLYPNNYSGKTDPQGFYIGRDKYGSNVLLDLDRRAEDKTNSNALILGSSGQGKSFLLKLLTRNILESGKSVICLDPEHEMRELAEQMGGCFVDLMGGWFRVNPLEPKVWDMGGETGNDGTPAAFKQRSRLSQHISFLKDFFRCYKDFSDRHIDVIEIMLERLYSLFHMDDRTDFAALAHTDFPILSNLYDLAEDAYDHYGDEENPLYPRALLQEVALGLRSMCKGADGKFFNGWTNVTSSRNFSM